MDKKVKITYVMDPQCGWCYGNSQNITALHKAFKDDFDFELLVGGMWLGENAPVGGNKLSAFLHHHAPRMTATTGAHIDDRYYELAKDSTYTFSSLAPSAAIRLVKEVAQDQVFFFAKKVQQALFVEGKKLDEKETYSEMLIEMDIDKKIFENRWMKKENIANTKAEFSYASSIARGLPTLLITKNSKTEVLASGYFNLEQMKKTLVDLMELFSHSSVKTTEH